MAVARQKVSFLPTRRNGPVSVSVSHKSVFYRKGWRINFVFGTAAFFDQPYIVSKEIQVAPK